MSEHSSNSAATTPARSRFGRLRDDLRHLPVWAKKNPVRAIVAGCVLGIVGTVAAVGGSYTLVRQVIYVEAPPDPLVEAYKALDAGRLREARELALQVARERNRELPRLAEPLYVLGVAICRSADLHWNPAERAPLYAIAAKYLEQVRNLGFPNGREEEGQYELGRSLHLAGRSAESIAELEEHLKLGGSRRLDALELLADASLQRSPPDFARAARYNDELLKDGKLPAERKEQASLRQARILYHQKIYEPARAVLAQIPATSPLVVERSLLLGRILLAEGDAARDRSQPDDAKTNYAAALEALRSVPSRDITAETIAATQYLMATCFDRQGEREAAARQWDLVRRQYRSHPEFVPASLDLAQSLLKERKTQEAVALVQELLGAETDPVAYRNPYLSAADVADIVARMRNELLTAKEFDAALELSRGPEGLIPASQFAEWTALTRQLRARHLEQQAETQPRLQADVLRREARLDHREAGIAFGKLAGHRRTTRYYIEDFWNSVHESFLGHDYARAEKDGREYLQIESVRMRPEALVVVGESQICLGRVDRARETLRDCLTEYPRHPVTYRARLLAAQAEVEQQHLREAMALLEENVSNDELSPRSTEWQESLFLLGKLHQREGQEWIARSRLSGIEDPDPEKVRAGLRDLEQGYQSFRRTIDTLSRAVERFPESRASHEARYQLAEAHRLASLWPLRRMRVITIESTRQELATLGDNLRRDAITLYDQAIEGLQEQSASDEPSPFELKLLRNCYFGKAGTLFDLGRYEEAVKTYSAATYRLQSEPEALEAYVQIAACYRLLNRPREARGTLEQARVMLKRLRPETNFLASTPYSREEWEELLTWLATL